MKTFRGFLFDIYHTDKRIYLWIKAKDGENKLFFDFYHPTIYAKAEPEILTKLVRRLYDLDALAEVPSFTEKKLFYQNQKVQVLKLVLSRPNVLPKITNSLYQLYGKYDIYHSDIEVTTSYMVEKNIFPLCELEVIYETLESGVSQIFFIKPESKAFDLEYNLPNFKIASLQFSKSHRIPFLENSLIIETSIGKWELSGNNPKQLLMDLNLILKQSDPDIILSSYGDQVILPNLFMLSQQYKIPLELDRDKTSTIRRVIKTEGTSFNTYGTIVFRAPSYPFFGRWHIDSRNSFVFKEAELLGIIELARISRLPIQKMARASTGKALTYIEVDVALRMDYLVPWQKSAVELPKSALQLLISDRGGLIYQPDISQGIVLENVAQLDFSQMYPSIMVIHNISPETINCLCCIDDPNTPMVPGIGYKICVKRRGIVSEALSHILDRRAYYKIRKSETTGSQKIAYNSKQSSLKWMLVTSFGYLGYRNAKFGKLESHESVTAFGREKLLTAKEIAEEEGYVLVHAITDSIFIKRPDSQTLNETELRDLCKKIQMKSLVQMDIEGIYSWLVFPPSTTDKQMPVANRYMGRFLDGSFKSRGIASRRKDIPKYIRESQSLFIQWMCQFTNIKDMQLQESEILNIYETLDQKLKKGEVSWKDLLIQRSTSQDPEEYEVDGATSLSLYELQEMGIRVQAGEKIKYLVANRKSDKKSERYITEERIQNEILKSKNQFKIIYDINYYRELLLKSFEEVWGGFSSFSNFKQLIDSQLQLW